jgi:uncharacterized membrane protein
MNIEVYRSWFIVGSLALMLVATIPALSVFVHIPHGSEQFSEIWLLDSSRRAEDYPFDVKVNETHSVYIGVGNHLGYSADYRVVVKFRNETQPLPVTANATPSALPARYEVNLFVKNSETSEELLEFRILDIERGNDTVVVKNLSIDNVTFQVDSFSVWNRAKKGFFYQLFFELWLYNMTSQSFQYHNRFVQLWLNMSV